MRRLIIDGYNLMYAMPGVPKGRRGKLEDARDHLVRKISKIARKRRIYTIVVFDGVQDDVLPMEAGINQWVQTRFSPPHKKADTIIVELVQSNPSPRSLMVVSSDKAVLREVTHAGAKTMTSEEFADLLEPRLRRKPEPPEEEKPEMTEADLEVWRRVFNKS